MRRRWQTFLLACLALGFGMLAVVMSVVAAADAEIALRGEQAMAIVEEVGPDRRTRQGWLVDLALRVTRPDGASLHGWSERPYRIIGSWSDPARLPAPGDGIAVFALAESPPRLVPVNAVGGFWGWLLTLPLHWLAAFGAGWAAWRHRRRTRATSTPTLPR